LTVGLSFNVAAAVRNLLNTSSVLSATGSAGAYEYRLDSAAQTDIRGTQIRTLMITPTLVGSNEYPFYRVFTFGLDGRMLSMGHTTFYNQAFLIRRDVDGWGDVTSQQDLPQSAKPGASGVWFTTRNRYLFADTAGAETGTTTFSFTLEADGETTALLRLKESTLDKATAATLTGEYVLRITAAGEVTPVSDSSTIRSTVLQVDPLAKPMFAVANVVQAFLASQFEHVVDGVTYKLARSSRGLDWVTSLSASTGTDMVQWRYTWNFSFDQGPRMIRTDRSSGSVATFNPEISEEAGLVSSSPRLPAAAAVGTTGIWFVADNVTTAGSSGTTTATFSLEPDTAATALLKLKVRTVSTTGSVRNGEVVLRISQTGLLALDTDKAILSLFNPT
jgi:hypothetical protein